MTDMITQILPDSKMLWYTITLTENEALLWHLYDSHIKYSSDSIFHFPPTVFLVWDDITVTVQYKFPTTVLFGRFDFAVIVFLTLPRQSRDSRFDFAVTVFLALPWQCHDS